MNFLEYNVPPHILIPCLCAYDFTATIPMITDIFHRFGRDFTAYVNQAGQFASGQLDYDRLAGVQGPCQYPAGHLWFYAPVYHLFMATENAELIWKVLTSFLRILIACLVSKLAYTYFKSQPYRAQLLTFVLFTNSRMADSHQQLYNDALLGLYGLLLVYFLAHDKPMLATLCAASAFSIKAGASVLLPSLLGWIHFFYGTTYLVANTILLFVVQGLAAYPFLESGQT